MSLTELANQGKNQLDGSLAKGIDGVDKLDDGEEKPLLPLSGWTSMFADVNIMNDFINMLSKDTIVHILENNYTVNGASEVGTDFKRIGISLEEYGNSISISFRPERTEIHIIEDDDEDAAISKEIAVNILNDLEGTDITVSQIQAGFNAGVEGKKITNNIRAFSSYSPEFKSTYMDIYIMK